MDALKELELDAAALACNPLIPANIKATITRAVSVMGELDARIKALETMLETTPKMTAAEFTAMSLRGGGGGGAGVRMQAHQCGCAQCNAIRNGAGKGTRNG